MHGACSTDGGAKHYLSRYLLGLDSVLAMWILAP
jgi:hypothetical protein